LTKGSNRETLRVYSAHKIQRSETVLIMLSIFNNSYYNAGAYLTGFTDKSKSAPEMNDLVL